MLTSIAAGLFGPYVQSWTTPYMFLLFYSDRAKKHVTECLAALAALASESPPQKRGPLSSGPVAVMCSSVLQDLRHVGHASIHRVLRRHQILPWLGELRQLRRRQEGSAIWSGRRRGRRGHPPSTEGKNSTKHRPSGPFQLRVWGVFFGHRGLKRLKVSQHLVRSRSM